MLVLVQLFKSQRGGYRMTEENVITYVCLLTPVWFSHFKLIRTKQVADFKSGSLEGLFDVS